MDQSRYDNSLQQSNLLVKQKRGSADREPPYRASLLFRASRSMSSLKRQARHSRSLCETVSALQTRTGHMPSVNITKPPTAPSTHLNKLLRRVCENGSSKHTFECTLPQLATQKYETAHVAEELKFTKGQTGTNLVDLGAQNKNKTEISVPAIPCVSRNVDQKTETADENSKHQNMPDTLTADQIKQVFGIVETFKQVSICKKKDEKLRRHNSLIQIVNAETDKSILRGSVKISNKVRKLVHTEQNPHPRAASRESDRIANAKRLPSNRSNTPSPRQNARHAQVQAVTKIDGNFEDAIAEIMRHSVDLKPRKGFSSQAPHVVAAKLKTGRRANQIATKLLQGVVQVENLFDNFKDDSLRTHDVLDSYITDLFNLSKDIYKRQFYLGRSYTTWQTVAADQRHSHLRELHKTVFAQHSLLSSSFKENPDAQVLTQNLASLLKDLVQEQDATQAQQPSALQSLRENPTHRKCLQTVLDEKLHSKKHLQKQILSVEAIQQEVFAQVRQISSRHGDVLQQLDALKDRLHRDNLKFVKQQAHGLKDKLSVMVAKLQNKLTQCSHMVDQKDLSLKSMMAAFDQVDKNFSFALDVYHAADLRARNAVEELEQLKVRVAKWFPNFPRYCERDQFFKHLNLITKTQVLTDEEEPQFWNNQKIYNQLSKVEDMWDYSKSNPAYSGYHNIGGSTKFNLSEIDLWLRSDIVRLTEILNISTPEKVKLKALEQKFQVQKAIKDRTMWENQLQQDQIGKLQMQVHQMSETNFELAINLNSLKDINYKLMHPPKGEDKIVQTEGFQHLFDLTRLLTKSRVAKQLTSYSKEQVEEIDSSLLSNTSDEDLLQSINSEEQDEANLGDLPGSLFNSPYMRNRSPQKFSQKQPLNRSTLSTPLERRHLNKQKSALISLNHFQNKTMTKQMKQEKHHNSFNFFKSQLSEVRPNLQYLSPQPARKASRQRKLSLHPTQISNKQMKGRGAMTTHSDSGYFMTNNNQVPNNQVLYSLTEAQYHLSKLAIYKLPNIFHPYRSETTIQKSKNMSEPYPVDIGAKQAAKEKQLLDIFLSCGDNHQPNDGDVSLARRRQGLCVEDLDEIPPKLETPFLVYYKMLQEVITKYLVESYPFRTPTIELDGGAGENLREDPNLLSMVEDYMVINSIKPMQCMMDIYVLSRTDWRFWLLKSVIGWHYAIDQMQVDPYTQIEINPILMKFLN